ncbi:MAG: thermonuclease family protein [Acidiferrobacterales bacterium]
MIAYLQKKASIPGAFLIYGFLFWQVSAFAAETVRVRQVVDGDSLRLFDGRKVRLIGINTPELGGDGQANEPLAVQAREELKILIGRRPVTLKTGPDRYDHYGRLLAYIGLPNGKLAGELLLQKGLASMIAVPPNLAHLHRYRLAEAGAKQQRVGIWAHPYYQPVAASSLDHTMTGYRFVQGRIKRVGKSRKYVYFDLTPDFAIAIDRNHWHYFGGNPQQWRGKKIVVRGWISLWRDKLKMRVGHPAMIEIQD